MRTESRLRVGDAIRPLVINALCERAPAALRAVRVQHSDAAAGLDPEIEDVPDVLVHERFPRSTHLLPDDHMLVLEKLRRPLSRELRRPLLRGCFIGLCSHGCHADQDHQGTDGRHTNTSSIETFHGAPPEDEGTKRKGDCQMNRRSSLLGTLAVAAACVASSCSQANDEADINASVQHLVAAVNAKDINGIMAYYTP